MTKTAIILAGGEARRMGGKDKGEIVLSGQRLIDLVLERLKPQVDQIFISGQRDYGTGLELISDLDTGPKGPAAALFAMINAYPGIEGFLTVPVDGPFFPFELYGELSGDGSAIATGPKREHPTFAFWTTADLLSVFSTENEDNLALHKIAELAKARKVTFRAESYFRNFNSPEDLDFAI